MKSIVLKINLIVLILFGIASAEIVKQQSFELNTFDTWNYTLTPETYYNTGNYSIWSRDNDLLPRMEPIPDSNGEYLFVMENNTATNEDLHWLIFDTVDLSAYHGTLNLHFYYYTFFYNTYDGAWSGTPDSLGYYIEYDNGSDWNNYVPLDMGTNAWTEVSIDIPDTAEYIRFCIVGKNSQWQEIGAFDYIYLSEETNEPTNHISDLTVSDTSISSITVSWNDNDGALSADSFLVKISENTIPEDPTDGVKESLSSSIKKVPAGIQSATFTGLSPNTSYNIAIYPYTCIDSYYDYKIVPQAPYISVTTPELDINVISGAIYQQSFEESSSDNWNFIASPSPYYETGNPYHVWHRDSDLPSSPYHLLPLPDNSLYLWNGENTRAHSEDLHTLTFNPIDISSYRGDLTLHFNYQTLYYGSQTGSWTGTGDTIGYYVEYDNGTNWDNIHLLNTGTNEWIEVVVDIPDTVQFVRLRLAVKNDEWQEIGAFDHIYILQEISEPSNHVTNLEVATRSDTRLTVTWDYNEGPHEADSFLVKLAQGNTPEDPVDGIEIPLSGAVNKIPYGEGSATFTGLSPSSSYTIAVYPYTYLDDIIEYKTFPQAPNMSASTMAPIKIMIAEIMVDPSAVNDKYGEWFEIYNNGTETVNIDGWAILDDGADMHTIDNGGTLNIESGESLVLGNSNDSSINGAYDCHYQYEDFSLNNNGDEIIISDGYEQIDKVAYNNVDWIIPSGASMLFVGEYNEDNNDFNNWDTSTERDGSYVGDTGDKGSPGIARLINGLLNIKVLIEGCLFR